MTQPDDPEETTVETMKWLTRRYLAVQPWNTRLLGFTPG
jgi:hypothetical protein